MKTELRIITPEIAGEMLKRNVSNRKLTTTHVMNLASEMKKGNWMFDGQPIRFSENGGLLDGQHRLNAVAESGLSQEFLILTGIDPAAFKVMDSGRIRTSSDIFSIEGIPNSIVAAACTKLVLTHLSGNNALTNGAGTSTKFSNTSLLEFYNKTPNLKKWISEASSRSKFFNKVLSPTEISALSFLMGEKNVIQSELFWDSVCNGLGLVKGSPIIALRNKLINDKLSLTSFTATYKKALIVKAWNYYRLNKSITYLNFNDELESYPTIL